MNTKQDITLEEATRTFNEVTLSDVEIFERVRKLKMSWSPEEQRRRSAAGVARRVELVELCNSELELVTV